MAFLNSVGASTGPLYATGLQRAARALAGAVDATPEIQAAIIKGIADGVRERGKGQRGDKTMLDAWIPAAEAGSAAVRRSATVPGRCGGKWSPPPRSGADATRSMVASKGRAARLGERALGHVDPGATSAVVILRAMAQTFCGNDGDTSNSAAPHVRDAEAGTETRKGRAASAAAVGDDRRMALDLPSRFEPAVGRRRRTQWPPFERAIRASCARRLEADECAPAMRPSVAGVGGEHREASN